MTRTLPLGEAQRRILQTLREEGQWHTGAPSQRWHWNTDSETARVLESLIKRGLVRKETRPLTTKGGDPIPGYTLQVYLPIPEVQP